MLWQTFTRQVRWFAAVLWVATWAGVADARATEVGTDREALREELAELRRKNVEIQRQLDELRRQLDALRPALARAPLPGVGAAQAGETPLDQAIRALELAPPAPTPTAAPGPAWGGARTSRFRLIDISLDVLTAAGVSSERDDSIAELQLGEHDPRKRGFTLQQAELSFLGAVDSYFTAEAHLLYFLSPEGESEFEVEEAFVTTLALPEGLQLEAGQFFTEFGRLNPQHPHLWAWQDQPVINSRLFGPDGVRGVGFRLGWLAPLPWFSELHLGMQNNGETMVSFLADEEVFDEGIVGRGRPFVERDVKSLNDLVYLVRWQNAWDVSDTLSTALGVSGLFGPNATGEDGDTRIYGVDLALKWRAAGQRRGWPFATFEAEVMRRDYKADDAPGFPSEVLQDWGFYAQALWGFRNRWAAGLRYEYASTSDGGSKDDPFSDDRVRVSPLLAFYPSEYSRIRLQYNLDHAQHLRNSNAHTLWLGVEFNIGAHAAHGY
jgi:hypothetical protein